MYILLRLLYDGTDYAGWQRQNNALAVQNVLEKVLKKIYGSIIDTIGSGRTDSGVHAGEQFVSYSVNEQKVPVNKLPAVINKLLPGDIRITRAEEIKDPDFHPRYSARVRMYRYILLDRQEEEYSADLFFNRYSWYPGVFLDEKKLENYLKPLIGTFDFTTFCSKNDSSTVKIREIFKIELVRHGKMVYIDIYGNAFLKGMIRSIVGTLMYAYRKDLPEDYLAVSLSEKDPDKGRHRAPACGLTLLRVYYNKLFGEREYYKRNEK